MSYIVFARKYRPQTFDEIIGQSPITTTLKNAVSQNRAAHAYIFTGPRGVGKTTTARILAKALNCEKGSSPEPCNSCASCNEITKGSSLDILEIDGASNRGIDEIRNLRENVKFSPSKARFKIYIIDEVHMLTNEAFNALLKTLEEPPPHVKFIFATTQAYKVPPTILSRCQRFDFRRISTKDIFENLKKIIKEEGLDIKDDALALIAKYSDGSMRDGQVILDQMISFAQGPVDTEGVVKVLGIVDEDILFGLSDSLRAKDAVRALKIIDSLMNEGKDAFQVVSSLIEHFRNISVIKISKSLDSLIDADEEKIKRYGEEAQKFTIEEILYIIYTLSNTIDFIRKTTLARVPLEVSMVKLAQTGPIASLVEILERINRLEKRPAEGRFEKPAPAPAAPEKKPDPPQNKPEINKPEINKPEINRPEMDEILSSWNSVINYIKTRKMSIASYLEEGYPMNLDSGALSIGFPEEFKFHKEVLESPENKRLIEEAIREALKLDLKIAFVLAESARPKEKENAPEDIARDEAKAKTEDEPIIKSAMDIFKGATFRESIEKRGPR